MKKLTLLLPVLVVCGCNALPDNPGEKFKPPTQATFDSQIEKIKNDPNMTEQAKQAAISGIEMSRRMNAGNGSSQDAAAASQRNAAQRRG